MYQDVRFPSDRVLREVWRAASDLQEQLKDPRIGQILEVALGKSNASEVSYAVAREASKMGTPNLALELAKRAAVQTVNDSDRAGAFVQHVFAEACNYIVSRDLPGNVGLGSRNTDVSQGVNFKNDLMQKTKDVVKDVSTKKIHPASQWTQLASRVVKKLADQEE
jgi:hypothetical protein